MEVEHTFWESKQRNFTTYPIQQIKHTKTTKGKSPSSNGISTSSRNKQTLSKYIQNWQLQCNFTSNSLVTFTVRQAHWQQYIQVKLCTLWSCRVSKIWPKQQLRKHQHQWPQSWLTSSELVCKCKAQLMEIIIMHFFQDLSLSLKKFLKFFPMVDCIVEKYQILRSI